ncbi:amino acid adenylation domain protein [Coleofasciculus chthonoplastes PCC 7420]|uniref:Amino acid adenylation domain protein n=1 Tax=Coleofasciculus chthonoplastes PCC 7420 TaxID=118168 RepID=B4VIG2_9CYAN|nr:non-ribosomal peptide synthetase [Coleofasciculus chthonoplastes]EDX78301.1 amino acid adenylation domain protein [Coleofasciculus chthonoplastes PCC 7420]
MDGLLCLTEFEQHQLLQKWTNTQTDYPRTSTIHDLFQRQAAKSPDAIAIAYQNQQLTYQELEQQSNQLAQYLQSLGVTTETLVSFYLERSPELIITILAILKAGGAYLPLDTSTPPQRLNTILEDAQAPILITQKNKLTSLPKLPDSLHLLCLDDYFNSTTSSPPIPPAHTVNSNNLAYVMYTSGSTGKPKGVCVPHRGVVRLVKNTNYAHFGADEVVLQLASIAFDAATFEIWGALLNGGKLVLMPAKIPSLQDIGTAIKHHKITTLWLTAGLFHLMVEEQIEALKPLQQLLAGGDVLSIPHVKKVLTELPDCQLINGYGPTENTTFTCCHQITLEDTTKSSIPIGRPIANTQVYILNPDLQPVPIGHPGELYIGGDGLARGYLNQPDLTQKRFIANPFSHDPNARLYKTGDKVRWRDDGVIEFLGRFDFQVKIRGFRVELAEIEAVLQNYPNVRNVVVLAREDTPGDKRLVAYLVPEDNHLELNPEPIKSFLLKKLPSYMIPSAFIVLDQFPLNINGKVDRRALPAPNQNLGLNRQLVKPCNPTEHRMAAIWQEILGVEVGVNQTFTDLGGNSLQATRILSRVRDAFGVDIPVSVMLQNRESSAATIASLAEYVTHRPLQDNVSEINPIKAIPHGNDLPLTVYQERIWLLAQRAKQHPIYNLPMVFRLQGTLNITLLEKAINQVIKRHESLRTIFSVVNGLPRQHILPELTIKISVVDVNTNQLSQAEEEQHIQTLINQEASHCFDLQADPLIRVKLFQLRTDDFILMMTCHHIISDGWSLSVLLNEISLFYTNLIQERQLNLPELTVNYGDFTLWHQQHQEDRETSLLNYWTNQLTGALPLLNLPTDHPRPAIQTYKGTIQYFHINQDVRTQIEAFSQGQGATLFMVLVAAFQILLHCYSHEDDIVIGSPIASRNHSSLENLIGCFANIIPLRTHTHNNPSFLEFLAQVKKVSLEGYTYLDFPAEKVLSNFKYKRNLSYYPWFQVVFILLNVPQHNFELPGLKITEKKFNKGAAICDLVFLVEPKTQGLQCSIEYNTALYNDETITRLIGHFQQLLQDILTHPEQQIKQLPLLTEAEASQLLPSPSADEALSVPNTAGSKHQFVEPRNELERQLQNIWETVFHLKPIGIRDNFFELGGHSLLGLRLFSKIQQQTGQDLPVTTVFEAPTIEELAKILQTKQEIVPESSVVTINPNGNKPPLFFVNSINYAWKLSSYFPKDQPVYCVNIFEVIDYLTQNFSQFTLNDIAQKFIEDMRQIQPQGPYSLVAYCNDSYLAFEIAQQLYDQCDQVNFLGLIDAIWGIEQVGFNFHYQNLRELGLSYLFQKIRYQRKLFCLIERIRLNLKKALSKLYSRLDTPIPRRLKANEVLEQFRQATNNYIPQAYPGKINLFISSELRNLSHEMFSNLARAGLDVQEIPGYHNSFLQSPQIERLAEKLQTYLT